MPDKIMKLEMNASGYRQKMYQKSLRVHVKVIPETVDNDCMIIISSWVSNMKIGHQ